MPKKTRGMALNLSICGAVVKRQPVCRRLLGRQGLEFLKPDVSFKSTLMPNKVPCSPHFEDFAREYLGYAREKKRSWKRDSIIVKSAEPHFRGMRMDDITPMDIARYRKVRAEEVKPGTVNRELACLKHMFNTAIKWGNASHNPVKEVKPLRAPRRAEKILNEEEAKRLISSAKGRTRSVITMVLNTGMKLGETLSLKWEDVGLAEGFIMVRSPRRERDRKIPLNSTLSALLHNLHNMRRTDSPYVFADPKTGHPVKKIEKSFKSALNRAGLQGYTFNDLRHSFAKRLAQSGVDPITVKELLGHSTLEVTKRYFQSTPESKRKAVELISKLL
jgi:site-specific recombinase XerD